MATSDNISVSLGSISGEVFDPNRDTGPFRRLEFFVRRDRADVQGADTGQIKICLSGSGDQTLEDVEKAGKRLLAQALREIAAHIEKGA